MFLFEQALLEEKQEQEVNNVETPETEEELEEQFSGYMCESIRLETAMVKADRKCTENYLAATTESDKEAVKAIFENTVTDFVKKSKEAIMKAINTVINWIKEKIKWVTEKLGKRVESVVAKAKGVDAKLKQKMDRVEVQFFKENGAHDMRVLISYLDQYADAYKRFMSVSSKKDLEHAKSFFDDLITEEQRKSVRNWMKEADSAMNATEAVQFGKVRSVVEQWCGLSAVKTLAKDLKNIIDSYNEAIAQIKNVKENDNPEWAKLALQYSREYVSLQRSIHLKVAIYNLKLIMVSTAAMAKATAGALAPEKKEATKESVSLLDDMLATIC